MYKLILRYCIYLNFCCFKPLSLHDIASILEENDNFAEGQDIDIFLLPPDTANDEQTDEDSGNEDVVDINNLPASLFRAPAELAASTSSEEREGPRECNEPLQKRIKKYNLKKEDFQYNPITW
jgi:hypothetical protein